MVDRLRWKSLLKLLRWVSGLEGSKLFDSVGCCDEHLRSKSVECRGVGLQSLESNFGDLGYRAVGLGVVRFRVRATYEGAPSGRVLVLQSGKNRTK